MLIFMSIPFSPDIGAVMLTRMLMPYVANGNQASQRKYFFSSSCFYRRAVQKRKQRCHDYEFLVQGVGALRQIKIETLYK